MTEYLPRISDQAVATLVAEIDTRGFGILANYVPAQLLNRTRDFVAKAVKASDGHYAGFTGPRELTGSGLDELGESDEFRDLMRRIYEKGTGRPAPPAEFHQVLRCLTGASGVKHSLHFHYDSFVVTALFAVEMPTSGQSGDLILLPNTRKIRSSYLINAFDKVLLDNPVTQFVLRMLTRRNRLPLVRVKPCPGNAYFFWGYRSIHTNEPCDTDKVRATALFHYANPHARSALRTQLRQ